jgi:flagellar basal-body rod protein FlgC
MDPMTGVFRGFDIATSGLHAELQRSEIVSSNLANMHVTRGPDGLPYRRKSVVFEEVLQSVQGGLGGVAGAEQVASGVRVAGVHADDKTPFFEVYDPGHPDANDQGFLLMSNVDVFRELVDLSVIERSFEANLSALRTYRNMLQTTIQNFRG